MNFLGLGTVAGRFRLFAVLEALSWLGLLVGMAFKYLPAEGNEIGVKIFGPVHGGIFVLFLLTALLAARELEWNWKTTVLALLSSIPPFFTVIFEVWAVRTGKLGELSAGGATESPQTLAASS
ncbi:DUF3817 domain-containing protein [Nocardia zapadnayensis]|uniref:DUF3817 domain-containing protein n=1 Tax=Nocardia rhamnosiphila TaxID=426716 RepID=UPI002246E50E|nr:DUF3817 domain-containing protein [Nocardia zapadnayensis]MCX0269296.1 DUF3817 domain-containing protein [Nocardia zapadnayensis]